MSGECKSYRLNDPMGWKEFMSMPDDLKITYIKLLRQKFNVPDKNIAEMFGVCKDHVCRTFKKLGLQRDVRISHPKWDKEGYYAWVNGVDKLPAPAAEEEPAEDPIHQEPEAFVEEDLPFEEPDSNIDALPIQFDDYLKVVEELKAVHEKDKAENEWLRIECDNLRMNVRILEAQMDVVRLIFGGKNNG